MSGAPPALEVRGITKRFPGVLANDNINLTLRKGQVLGLLGENGAGKSTLMNMIYGLYKPDEGEILVNGAPVEIAGPKDAIGLGIGMVHQHFQLVDVLTVTENVMLGNEAVSGPFLRRDKARREIQALSGEYGLDVDPDALISDLPVGVQQRVEIIKALYRHADILILDEPTAVLTPQETRGLFKIMRALLDKGVSIIFISHKLKEVLEICDDVVVLRRGAVAGQADPRESTEQSLASLMVGRDVILEIDKSAAKPGDEILNVVNLSVRDDRGLPAVEGVSLGLQRGEILGIAGVQGNGQTELVEALTGMRAIDGGRFFIKGSEVTGASPRSVTEMGVGHVPEDRQRDGLVASFTVMHNLVLCSYYREAFSRAIVVDDRAIADNARQLVEQYDVRPPIINNIAGGLSGGNQQKVIVAREFSRDVDLLIASQPTRGLDVGSIEFIHRQILRMRDAGAGILLVSSELDEVLSLADRVAVMFEGEIIDIFDIDDADRDTVGLRMAGVRDETQMVGAS
ncbi:MAG: ABC transporter ATP-binding protein [Chloroflexota bacterium]|nr:ABC transporter ATP-binding protein [Chloroflexota bacterium]MDE2910480.1 ABC transporter ATP-binding protein [Chloroflexota bacterium]